MAKNRDAAELMWVGEDGRLRLLAERRFTSLGRLLEEMLDSRVESIGVSKEVGEALKKNGRVLRGERLAKEARRKAWLKEGLARDALRLGRGLSGSGWARPETRDESHGEGSPSALADRPRDHRRAAV